MYINNNSQLFSDNCADGKGKSVHKPCVEPQWDSAAAFTQMTTEKKIQKFKK